MNCLRCHHSAESHCISDDGDPLMKLGRCRIPGCPCKRFQCSIRLIDEELA